MASLDNTYVTFQLPMVGWNDVYLPDISLKTLIRGEISKTDNSPHSTWEFCWHTCDQVRVPYIHPGPVMEGLNCIVFFFRIILMSLQWRHNEHDGDSNQPRLDCLHNRLFRRRSKKTSKLCVTGLCEGNSPVTGEFPAQRTSNTENVYIWWRHVFHGYSDSIRLICTLHIAADAWCGDRWLRYMSHPGHYHPLLLTRSTQV